MNEEATDLVIVGGGPIGIELGIALRKAGVRCLQIEAGQIGSTIEWWAPGTWIFSSPERIEIAGVPLTPPNQTKATREQYLDYLRAVVRQHELPVRTYERAIRIERDAEGFRLVTQSSAHGVGGPEEAARVASAEGRDRIIRARRVVLAIGNMHRPRLLGIPGEQLPHVSHFFADPHVYFGRRVLIVGGKNSAVEAALRCYRVGSEVAISYRGDAFDPNRIKYWLRPEIEWLIAKGRIGWHPRTTPVEIRPEHVVLADVDDPDTQREHAADHVLLLTGYVQDASLLEQLGVERAGPEQRPVFDTRTMETSVPGVYVAGTVIGGSQRRTRIFIENAHVHVDRIVRAVTGQEPPAGADPDYATLEES